MRDQSALRDQRMALAMTQGHVAAAAGISQQTLSKLETGRMRLTAEYIDRLAAVFGCHPANLLKQPLPDMRRDVRSEELLALFLSMPNSGREALLTCARALAGAECDAPAAPTRVRG